MNRSQSSRSILLSSALVLASGAGASAELIVGLTTGGALVSFDSANPAAVLSTSPAITGLSSGDSIVDIDYYPVDGKLYGIGSATGTVYKIDRLTGAAVVDAVPQGAIGSPQDIDFNPAADRLRVFSSGDANYRITPSAGTGGPSGASTGLVSSDGTLAFASGANPNLVGAAYINNFDGTAATTLFSLDADLDALIVHSGSPQFSTLSQAAGLTLGGNPFDIGQLVGFDVSNSGVAFVSNGNDLYTINIGTGVLGSLGSIGGLGSIQTIAAVPAPGAVVVGIGSLAGLAMRRRR